MITTTLQLYNQREYKYPIKGGFIPTLRTYIHEEDVRDAVLIVPGGGYAVVTPAEGEVVAKKFYEAGYNAFVVTYTINFTNTSPLLKQPIKDVSRAVRVIRNNKDTFKVNDNVYAVGFSAGGHILTLLCEDYDKPYLQDEVFEESNKPTKLILAYPAFDVSPYVHTNLVEHLLGKNPSDELLNEYNALRHVRYDLPPIYMWNTVEDAMVSPKQALDFKDKCDMFKVKCIYRQFAHGPHGLSTADEDWALGKYGEPYTIEQIITEVVYALENDETDKLPKPFNTVKDVKEIPNLFYKWQWGDKEYSLERKNDEVASWFDEAVDFLKQ